MIAYESTPSDPSLDPLGASICTCDGEVAGHEVLRHRSGEAGRIVAGDQIVLRRCTHPRLAVNDQKCQHTSAMTESAQADPCDTRKSGR
eukprot:1185047-Prorocentrum_minimum.AAC.1